MNSLSKKLLLAGSTIAVSAALSLAASVSASAQTLPGTAASPADQTGCVNIGNGDLCITVSPGVADQNNNVTVWYHKLSGSPVYVHLGYFGYNVGLVDDQGPFWESAGQNRGYIWYGQDLPAGCYSAELFVVDPSDPSSGGAEQINGGSVCI
jgi:hypothetical protein